MAAIDTSSLEDKIVLNVLLNCEHTKSSETKQIHFQSLPTTPLEIKKKIEEDFSIPSCVQTLHYQSMILKDSDQLQHTHFRSGDTFTVDYPIEAECEMVQTVIKWLKELCDLLKPIEEGVSSPNKENADLISSNSQKIRNLMTEGERAGILGASLTYSLFTPWRDKKKLMNKFYFHQEGGLDALMKVYSVLISKNWGDLGIDKEFHVYLEYACCHAVWYYAETFQFLHQVVQLGGLEMCTTTLLRRRLQGEKNILDTRTHNTLRSALYFLCRSGYI